MKLGILSDSHDREEALFKGIDLLKEAGAEYFVHCGDVCEKDMLAHLAGLPAAFRNQQLDRLPRIDPVGAM